MGKWVFVDEFSRAAVDRFDMRDTVERGTGVIRDVAARIELDGGAPVWVEGRNRAWLAAAISGAVGEPPEPHLLGEAYLARFLELGGAIPSWKAVAEFLAARDDVPAVVTYSVCDSFPSPTFAPDTWSPEPGDEAGYDAFHDLPYATQWALCMPFLRVERADAELSPDLGFMGALARESERRAALEAAWREAVFPTLTAVEVDALANLPQGKRRVSILASSVPPELEQRIGDSLDSPFGWIVGCRFRPKPADYRDLLRWIERAMLADPAEGHALECDEARFEATLGALVAHDPACVVGISGAANLARALRLHPELAGRAIMTSFRWEAEGRFGYMTRDIPEDEQLASIRPLSERDVETYAGRASVETYRMFLDDRHDAMRERREMWAARMAERAAKASGAGVSGG